MFSFLRKRQTYTIDFIEYGLMIYKRKNSSIIFLPNKISPLDGFRGLLSLGDLKNTVNKILKQADNKIQD